jgi:tetratricopeptide (TPR) repeat protein
MVGSRLGNSLGRSLRSEAPADIASPKTVDRPAFRFQIPGNWNVDATRKHFDPDHSFFVYTANKQGFVMFKIINDERDSKSELERAVANMKANQPATKVAAFSNWGKYKAEGEILSGESRDGDFTERILVFVAARRTFMVIEWLVDDFREKAGPGFRLVEDTFEVRGADSSTLKEQTHEQKAQQFYDRGWWDQAAEEFEQAYRARNDPAFLFNMALCYRQKGDAKRALDLYENYLSKVPDSPKRADIEMRMKAIRQELADADRAKNAPAQSPAAERPVLSRPPLTSDGKQVQ